MSAKVEDEAVLHPTVHPLKIFEVAKSQNRFLYASAPMVRYSKLAFRQTVQEFGVDLTFTPMIVSKEFNRHHIARDSDLTISTRNPQPPTVVQFGANSPLEFSRAASLAAPFANGIDLNCGCPQGWACACTMGAALMEKRELVREMVTEAAKRLREDGWVRDRESRRGRSISVKIRIHKDLRNTIDFLNTVIGDFNNPSVDWITIHPRTRRTPSTTPIDTEALQLLTSEFGSKIPVLLSGDIFTLSSLPFTPSAPQPETTRPSNSNPGPECPPTSAFTSAPSPTNTGLAGLMAARGLLTNPALFAGYETCPWEAVESFARHVVRAPIPYQLAQHHLSEMCGPGMGTDKSALLDKHERKKLQAMTNMVDILDLMDEVITRKKGQEGGLRRYG